MEIKGSLLTAYPWSSVGHRKDSGSCRVQKVQLSSFIICYGTSDHCSRILIEGIIIIIEKERERAERDEGRRSSGERR
jgi:hypothetical protein